MPNSGNKWKTEKLYRCKMKTENAEQLVLVKSQETGELFRTKRRTDIHPDLRVVKKLGGYDLYDKCGELIHPFSSFRIVSGL